MEKIIYALYKPENQNTEEFRDQLLKSLAPKILPECEKLRVCVVDEDVSPAAPYRIQSSKPSVDGILGIWVNTAIYRQAIDDAVSEFVSHFHSYLVTESEPLVNTEHRAPLGERTTGMNEVVFLQKPPRLSYEEWIDIWHGSHTQVAIDTQSTFGYRQNVVTRSLSYAAPHYDAIIEENFPEEAISSRDAFYDAIDNPELKAKREQEMVDSCMRFIDFDKIDCIPMSEYILKD